MDKSFFVSTTMCVTESVPMGDVPLNNGVDVVRSLRSLLL